MGAKQRRQKQTKIASLALTIGNQRKTRTSRVRENSDGDGLGSSPKTRQLFRHDRKIGVFKHAFTLKLVIHSFLFCVNIYPRFDLTQSQNPKIHTPFHHNYAFIFFLRKKKRSRTNLFYAANQREYFKRPLICLHLGVAIPFFFLSK